MRATCKVAVPGYLIDRYLSARRARAPRGPQVDSAAAARGHSIVTASGRDQLGLALSTTTNNACQPLMPARKKSPQASRYLLSQVGTLQYSELQVENMRCGIKASGQASVLLATLKAHIRSRGTTTSTNSLGDGLSDVSSDSDAGSEVAARAADAPAALVPTIPTAIATAATSPSDLRGLGNVRSSHS